MSDELDARLLDLHGLLLSEHNVGDSLRQTAELALDLIPACEGASITLATERGPTTGGAAGSITVALDECQYEAGEGPCIEAIRTGDTVKIVSISEERRWPKFIPLAVREGLMASLSIPLSLQRETLGALNLYSCSDPFGPRDEAMGARIAHQAAVALANAQAFDHTRTLVDQLTEALETRDTIGQAKGIIMATRRCSADEAFAELRRISQDRNIKLREVARQIVNHVDGAG